jgi:hypothetical protein
VRSEKRNFGVGGVQHSTLTLGCTCKSFQTDVTVAAVFIVCQRINGSVKIDTYRYHHLLFLLSFPPLIERYEVMVIDLLLIIAKIFSQAIMAGNAHHE